MTHNDDRAAVAATNENYPRNQLEAEQMDGPADAAPPTCHLVVGFDQRPSSRAALIVAIDLAGRLNAIVHVMHVVDDDDMPIDPDSADWEVRIAEVVEQQQRAASAMLAALPGKWTYHSERGNPTELLANLADIHDAAMIVVGASRGGVASVLERLCGESVSSTLTHHSHRPVLLVPSAGGAQ